MEKLYEIAQMKNGEIVGRGGIKASRRTVGRWIEANKKNDPLAIFVAVPANEDAITIEEYKKECAEYAAEYGAE